MRTEKWRELLAGSGGMTRPYAAKQLLNREETAEMLSLFPPLFVSFFRRGENHRGLRVYLDGLQANEANDRLARNLPEEGEALAQWLDRLFPGESLGMVLNDLELHGDPFLRCMAEKTAPLLETAGTPLGGLGCLALIGDYAATPFGIHRDSPGQEGFLFHLGPGVKKLHFWNPDAFRELTGDARTHPLAGNALEMAEKTLTLEPGDVACVPHRYYHIGENEGFSVSIVLDYVNPSPDRLKTILAERLVKNTGKREREEERFLPPLLPGDRRTAVVEGLEMETEIDRHLMLLQSNGGYARVPLSASGWNASGGKLALVRPFPLFFRDDGDGWVTLFARGRENRFPGHRALEEWVRRLNGGAAMTPAETLGLFAPEWQMPDVYGLLAWLGSVGALEAL